MQYMNALFFLASAVTIRGDHASLLMDVNEISEYWGTLSPYIENSGNSFGIEHTGLPEGCQVVRIHIGSIEISFSCS
ncbi:hypothetical protein K3495_g13171 [Podosphaera aphanis]|nr:hypothetical protein K3495_g13171 [Podosphaera aphanis]